MSEATAPTTYFSSTDVAKFCGCTVHTVGVWARAERIKSFRTPGNQLRFRPADLLSFLEAHGYDVPEVVREATGSRAA